jgi:hypothetical protein
MSVTVIDRSATLHIIVIIGRIHKTNHYLMRIRVEASLLR